MSEVQMNHKAQRPNKMSSFFVTCNYAAMGEAANERIPCDLEHLKIACEGKMTQTLGDPENYLQLATFWEERGHDTGNAHWHGIFVLTRQHRMRPQQFKAWLLSLVEELPEPHVEECKSIKAAAEYRDKPGKAEAWQKWAGTQREPAFFVLIRMACYKAIPEAGEELILQSCANGTDLMKRL